MQEIFKQVAQKLNISIETVSTVYKAYWQFIREHIVKLPLKDNLSPEEFEKLKTNFNLPSLGKLTCTYDKWEKVKRREEFKYDNTIKSNGYKKD